jgi:hypothetical protein
MPGHVLLLLDSIAIREEAIHYAIELAARTDGALVLLIALPVEAAARVSSGSDWAGELAAAVQAELGSHETAARAAGVALAAVLRVGDQPSEVLKYLAGANDVRTVVWGGAPDAMGRNGQTRSTHWLSRIERAVDCPLVVPRRRAADPTGEQRP